MTKPRIGVYVCWCGSNIAKMVDVEGISKEIAAYPNVVVSRDYKYMCSDPGQDLLIKDVKEFKLDRAVVASCSPRMHELTFRKALENAGLNPYLFEMANIREQCSWVHEDRTSATAKARELIIASINRVVHHEPLEKREVEVCPTTLVIGGGTTGMMAALDIADSGKKVFLVERTEILGGLLGQFNLMVPTLESAKNVVNNIVRRVQDHANIQVLLKSEVSEVTGYVGNFEAKINSTGKSQVVKVGNIIVAIGLQPFDATRVEGYGYGTSPHVVTSLEFEKMTMDGRLFGKNGRATKSVVFVNCVGSRDSRFHEYCSRTCCHTALKQAFQFKSKCPQAFVFVAYSDIRAFGKGCEEFYEKTCASGVSFGMFDKNDTPRVKASADKKHGNLTVFMNEKLSGESIEIDADLVVLSIGMEARSNAKEIGHLVGISLDKDGFFIEKHPKLDPVATTTDGVFIAGACQGPKDLPDAVAQGRAAAARVLQSIMKGVVEVEVITSTVNEDLCSGCQTCIKVCPYGATVFNAEKKVSSINEVLCKGCGTCTSACPCGAIKSRHFTRSQIISQIEGLLGARPGRQPAEDKKQPVHV